MTPQLQAYNAQAVTPNNTTDITPGGADINSGSNGVSLYIGGAGDVTVDMVGGSKNITFVGVPAGTFMPIQVSRVYATGTDATDIVAIF